MSRRKGRPVHHSERPSQHLITGTHATASIQQDPDSQAPDTAETRLRTPAGSIVTIDLDRIFRRWLQDVMTEATAAYWLRRAGQLDRIGTEWSVEAAEACRNHARLMGGEFGNVEIR